MVHSLRDRENSKVTYTLPIRSCGTYTYLDNMNLPMYHYLPGGGWSFSRWLRSWPFAITASTFQHINYSKTLSRIIKLDGWQLSGMIATRAAHRTLSSREYATLPKFEAYIQLSKFQEGCSPKIISGRGRNFASLDKYTIFCANTNFFVHHQFSPEVASKARGVCPQVRYHS